MRIRLDVSYHGGRYAGWQVQPDAVTVQGTLEDIVERLSGTPTRVTGASRTDAGVHAAGQVCHFDASKPIATAEWQRAFNKLLPQDIRVLACREVGDAFHARHAALRKTYRYHVDPAPIASPFLAPFCWHRPGIARPDAMRGAARAREGEICQRVFASRPEGDRDVRANDAVIVESDRLITFTVTGRSFMRHAVRGMVGSLLEVGYGRRSAADLAAMAQAAPGHLPMVKAPAKGLCLVGVEYPAEMR